MTANWRPESEQLVGDLRRIFGERLQSVVAYGARVEGGDAPLQCLALVESLTSADLAACAQAARTWNKGGVGVPLILPGEEFLRSLDAFPLEYGEILRSHQRVFGDDPFSGLAIAREDLRRACETQVKSHLIHLRESYIQSGGKPAAVAELVAASAPGFAALLRQVASLVDGAPADASQAAYHAARAARLPEGLVADILSLADGSVVSAADPARLFPEYLSALEQLSRAVDSWHA